MSITLNKQPIFTATPKLVSLSKQTYKIIGDQPDTIYADSSVYGYMVNRVTITPYARIGDSISANILYLMVSSASDGINWSLISSQAIAGVTVVVENPTPFYTFTFTPDLILPPSSRLGLLVSDNTDELLVTVEIGTFDI